MATVKENEAFTKAIMPGYPLDDAIEFIQKNLNPEDVFHKKDLENWASENGYEAAP